MPLSVLGKGPRRAPRRGIASTRATSSGSSPILGLPPAVVEIPFSWIATPLTRKPTTAITKAQITQTGGATAYSSATAAQVRQYGVNTATVTLDTAVDADAQNLATMLTTYESAPRPRQPTLTFDLFDLRWATDANARIILGVGLAQHVRITGAPATWPPGALEFTVEGISQQIGVEVRTVTWATAALVGTVVTGGLLLPGTAGNYASTPDNAALDIVGDIDLRVDVTLSSWVPATFQTLLGKWNTGQDSYRLGILNGNGKIQLAWSTDGSSASAQASTVSPTPPASGRLAVRATLQVNSAGSNVVTFYTAPTLADTWTQLGTPVTTGGVTSIFSGSAIVEVGSNGGGTNEFASGTVYGIEVRNGIGGTVVASPDFKSQIAGTTSFVDAPGRTWTVNGGVAKITPTVSVPGPWFRRGTSSRGGTDTRPF